MLVAILLTVISLFSCSIVPAIPPSNQGQESLTPLSGAETWTSPEVPSLHAQVVGQYRDCSGNTPLASNGAYVDVCVTSSRYVVGHNMDSILRPLHFIKVGDHLSNGPYQFQVVRVTRWRPWGTVPELAPGAIMQAQVCEDGTSYYDEIVDFRLVG